MKKKVSLSFISIIFIISISIIIFMIVGYLLKKNLYDMFVQDIIIIISRYNEDLRWTLEYPFNQFRYIVYNKGDNDEFEKKYVDKVIRLPNVGKCDHTYLYHICHSYEKLSRINVFLPGSLINNKKTRASTLLSKIKETGKAVFLSCMIDKDIKNEYYDFKLDYWKTSNSQNFSKNNESKLEKSLIRPFGKWFTKRFGNVSTKNVCFMGIFSIGKNDILQHPKEKYISLMNELNHSNPEVGHYIERSWGAIFYPLNDTIVYKTPECFS